MDDDGPDVHFYPPQIVWGSGGRRLSDLEVVRLSVFASREAGRLHRGVQSGDADALRRVFLTAPFGGPVGALRRELDTLDGTPRPRKKWRDE